MSKIIAQQELYDNDGEVVAKPGEAVEIRDDSARWFVEQGVAVWPPRGANKSDADKEKA
jgi:hypothetical protein